MWRVHLLQVEKQEENMHMHELFFKRDKNYKHQNNYKSKSLNIYATNQDGWICESERERKSKYHIGLL